MKALVVYESMYGNTRKIAESIAAALGCAAVPVKEASSTRIVDADLVVIGGPTHAFGMSRESTRRSAAAAAAKADSGLEMEPDATTSGLREWLPEHGAQLRLAAAFDTRINWPSFFGGHASRRIARMLRRNGARLVDLPRSFRVNKRNQLLAGELECASAWGRELSSRAPRL
jgi:hypothetical protein